MCVNVSKCMSVCEYEYECVCVLYACVYVNVSKCMNVCVYVYICM